MIRPLPGLLSAVCLIAALPSCVDGGFDPAGTTASLSFEWAIRGERPTASECAALGAVKVRLAVRDGAGWRRNADLEWPCETGSADTGAIFRPSTVEPALELVDPDGAVTGWSVAPPLTLLPGENSLGTIDLAVATAPADASLSIRWTVGGVTADAESCAATGTGATTVRLVWRLGTLEGPPVDFPCVDGAGVANLAFRSGYPLDFRLRLLDADGFGITQSPWYADRTLEPGDNELPLIDLSVSSERVPLAAILWWADEVESPAYVSCSSAGVESFGYSLENSTGAVVDAVAWDAAPLACTEYISWPAIPAGIYDLTIDGVDETGARRWTFTCYGLDATDSRDNTFECLIPRIP